MAVEWTEHRFSGGALALDVANAVVLRIDPARRFDRFDDPAEIVRFADAASAMRADELRGARLVADASDRKMVVRLREATDALFRDAVERGRMDGGKLSSLLAACSDALARCEAVSGSGAVEGSPVRLDAALAMSAIGLLREDRLSRLRICANCGWLFLDRSRNGSRIWCDMAVCGNRRKAARHYRRRKGSGAGDGHAIG